MRKPARRPSAIPYIEKNGTAWIKDRNCMACHYAGYMLWSLRDASQRGFAIDKGKLAESTNWAISQTDVHGFGYEGAAQMLIARDRSVLSENTVKRIDAMRDVVIMGQKKDGSWDQAASSHPRSGRFSRRSR